MAVETSSAAGAITSVLEVAADVIAEMMFDLMAAKSVAAAAITPGAALTNDIAASQSHNKSAMTRHRWEV
jgi:hypothetical protein